MAFENDKELQEYRDIMKPPDIQGFEDGFNWKTIVGAFFLGVFMMPASEYLTLFIGSDQSINQAARWVTIILFSEIARRSFTSLRAQELYTLYYMTGLAMGSPFEGYLWKQYVAQSDFVSAMGIAQDLPGWAFPSSEALESDGKTFFSMAWLPIIALTTFGVVINRIDNYGLGYVLYRVVNDVEKLPFPFAPVGAAGIVALTDERDERDKWRWRCFAIGSVIGMLWAAIYIAVPVVSDVILAERIELIPLVWVDYTPQVSSILPAVPFNLVLDLGMFLAGMMAPFWAVIGGFLGVLFTMAANPILHQQGVLSSWEPGMGFVDTMFRNNVDFYMSFGIGMTLAITLISFGMFFQYLFKSLRRSKAKDVVEGPSFSERFREGWRILVSGNAARGDFSIWIALLIYLGSTFSWILLGRMLIGPEYPWLVFVGYAVIYTPLISYATAKLEGLVGRSVGIPYLRELTIILSGYKGVDIWFAPAPIQNLGAETVGFRVLELTGTKIKSQIKTLIVVTPIVAIASLMTSQLLWQMADIPSDAYPFTQKMWELNVRNWALQLTATMEGGSMFLEALSLEYIVWGVVAALGVFAVLTSLSMPVNLIFGAVAGLNQQSPGAAIWMTMGALVGKFYFKRKFRDMWLKYMAVILAGFGCGMGLISMVALAFRIITAMLGPSAY